MRPEGYYWVEIACVTGMREDWVIIYWSHDKGGRWQEMPSMREIPISFIDRVGKAVSARPLRMNREQLDEISGGAYSRRLQRESK